MASPRPLNILLYITHDTGQHFLCYGAKGIETPSLDRMAGEGVRFVNHFAAAPNCSPSRAALLTGCYPQTNGMMGLANPNSGWRLPKTEFHAARILGDAGYDSVLFGVQHEIDRNTWPGATQLLGYKERRAEQLHADEIEPELMAFLKQRSESQGAPPFFACIGTQETHRPFTDPGIELDDPKNICVPPFLPDAPEVRQDLAEFQGAVKVVDRFIGRILQQLDQTGLSKNTLFIYTTDHGIPYSRAKATLYDAGIKTALVMRGPGEFNGGKIFSELVSNIDVLPTILEALGAEIPQHIEGRSMLPLIQGAEYTPREEIFAAKTYHARYDPMRCIRTDRYKYIRNWKPEEPMEMGGDSRVKIGGNDLSGYYPETRAPEELYDLDNDPDETNNLAESPEYAEVFEDMRSRLMNLLSETSDPILDGTIYPQPTSRHLKVGRKGWPTPEAK